MPNTITIGNVKTVTSATTGTIKDLAGNTITYSDATLALMPVREHIFVIFGFLDTPLTTNICSLTGIYAQGLRDANSANALTAASIKRQLQVNSCCAAKKGAEHIEKFKKNIPCNNQLLDDAEKMLGIIHGISGFVPENEIISGRQATYLISVTATALPKVVSLTIGTAVYSFTSSTSDATTFAADIAVNINAEYPQNFPFYATASGGNVIISGSTFNSANGIAVSGSTTNGTITFLAPNVLAGGTAKVLQGVNGITNEQVQKILDKLNKLCATPCEEVVNFARAADNNCYLLLESLSPLQLEQGGFALLEQCVN